jgi:hypothetical protein
MYAAYRQLKSVFSAFFHSSCTLVDMFTFSVVFMQFWRNIVIMH